VVGEPDVSVGERFPAALSRHGRHAPAGRPGGGSTVPPRSRANAHDTQGIQRFAAPHLQ